MTIRCDQAGRPHQCLIRFGARGTKLIGIVNYKNRGPSMSETEAKKMLKQMLRSWTVGSVLHLLGEAFWECKQGGKKPVDPKILERCEVVHDVLYVVGVGLDGAVPH